jgi:2-polyprenyl-3-methyl-5-hydroxy-6-metoxy-1,4-benzoquinol methylase
MRTAADFNQFYAAEHDPWHISRARFRDKGLRRSISKFVIGKSVLELGCGEGHLTQSIFSETRMVTGVDISDIAIERARLAISKMRGSRILTFSKFHSMGMM